MTHLQDINFTEKQKLFICSAINIYGDGEHPYANLNTFQYFTISYIKTLLNDNRLVNNLNPSGLEILTEIKSLFN